MQRQQHVHEDNLRLQALVVRLEQQLDEKEDSMRHYRNESHLEVNYLRKTIQVIEGRLGGCTRASCQKRSGNEKVGQ